MRTGDIPRLADEELMVLLQYEVRLRRGKRIERSSLFTVAHDGSGAAPIPERLAGVDEVMVTREPAGGSDQPSDEPLVRVPVRS
jgi:hypothetical protein